MNRCHSQRVEIRVADAEQQEAALRMLLQRHARGDSAQVANLPELARDGVVDLQSLLVAIRSDTLVGTAWSNRLPGRCAAIWPPELASEESEDTADRLLDRLEQWNRTYGVRISQALLPSKANIQSVRLIRNGFVLAAELLYMCCRVPHHPVDLDCSELEFIPYVDDAMRQRLAAIVQSTYEDTLDCPKLNNRRSTDDILEGYAATGSSGMTQWTIVQRGHKDVGCLLLADHPEHNNMELVYMGIVRNERGCRWGRVLCKQALRIASTFQRRHVVLAVDSANSPAIDAYRDVGFDHLSRQFVFLKFHDDGGTSRASRI